MMPFSVLRIWGLGVISWLVLGAGVYCAWRAYEEFSRSPQPVAVDSRAEVAAEQSDDRTTADEPPLNTERPAAQTERAWWFTAAATGLLLLSFGGFLPARWLLGNATGPEPEPLKPAKEMFVDRPDGSRLHVEVYGSDTAPTLLLTHGWSLDVSTWDYVKRRLAERFRLVMWDLPGLGRSRGPQNRDFSIEKMAHDLDAVIRATATRSPLLLVSHSIGCMTTQTFCRLHPEHLGSTVQGLVLIHPTYTNPLRTCALSGLATALEMPLITPLNYLTIALAPVAWLSNWQSYLNGSLHVMTRFASFSGQQTRQQLDHASRLAAEAWPGAVARGNLAMQRFNEERTLPRISVPALLIAGEHDRMTRPEAADHMSSLLPNDRPFRVVSGHLSYWERPAEVVEVIEEFAKHVVPGAHLSAEATQPRTAPTP